MEVNGGGAEEMGVAAMGSDVAGGGVEEDICRKCEITNLSRSWSYASIIPTKYGERTKLERLTGMESAAVGFTDGEVLLRWLAGLKNWMNSTNTSRRRSNSGDLPVNSSTAEEKLGGGAALRGETGGANG
jgi:hypothetical protein